jgi:hypothetical protein
MILVILNIINAYFILFNVVTFDNGFVINGYGRNLEFLTHLCAASVFGGVFPSMFW